MRTSLPRSLRVSALLLAFALLQPSPLWAGWEWMNPSPTGGDILGIWGSTATDIDAISLDGSLVHYDGQSLSIQDIGKEFACPDKGFWQALWGTSSSDIYMVGRTILHFDEVSWTSMSSGLLTGSGGPFEHFDRWPQLGQGGHQRRLPRDWDHDDGTTKIARWKHHCLSNLEKDPRPWTSGSTLWY